MLAWSSSLSTAQSITSDMADFLLQVVLVGDAVVPSPGGCFFSGSDAWQWTRDVEGFSCSKVTEAGLFIDWALLKESNALIEGNRP